MSFTVAHHGAGLLDPAVERRVIALGVSLVCWDGSEPPSPDNRRACPVLYLVPGEMPPPQWWDQLTDWVRLPVPGEELVARAESLAAKAAAAGVPGVVLDRDGVLHADGRSVPLSELQVRLLEPLLAQPGSMIQRHELIAQTWPDGSPADPRAIDNRVKLLRRRLRGTPIAIHAIRGRGFVLTHAAPTPPA